LLPDFLLVLQFPAFGFDRELELLSDHRPAASATIKASPSFGLAFWFENGVNHTSFLLLADSGKRFVIRLLSTPPKLRDIPVSEVLPPAVTTKR
jgi:hypothetical protein